MTDISVWQKAISDTRPFAHVAQSFVNKLVEYLRRMFDEFTNVSWLNRRTISQETQNSHSLGSCHHIETKIRHVITEE